MRKGISKGANKLKKVFSLKVDSKAETGIGTLIVFIAMVLVAAVAATVLIHTAGTLQQRAQSTGTQTTNQVSTGLEVTQISGIDNNTTAPTYGHIEWIAIYLTDTAGSQPVNLANVTITLTYKGVTSSLVYIGATGFKSVAGTGTQNVFNSSYFSAINGATNAVAAQTHFAILALSDSTNSLSSTFPVLQFGDQVALLVNVTAVFGINGITQGQSVAGQVTPPAGNPGVIQFTAPEAFTQAVVQLQ